MKEDEPTDPGTPAEPTPANSPATPAGMLAWLPWFAAAGCALIAGFMLAVSFALREDVTVLREQAALAEIQEKTLRQQIEAEQILSARRLEDLRCELEGPHDPERLQIVPLAPPPGVVSPSLAVAMWDPDLKEGELVVSALPAPEADTSYQLWLFDSEHPAGKSIAVFAVDSRSIQVRVPFKLDRSGAAGASFKVSIERKGGASIPGGHVVLASR